MKTTRKIDFLNRHYLDNNDEYHYLTTNSSGFAEIENDGVIIKEITALKPGEYIPARDKIITEDQTFTTNSEFDSYQSIIVNPCVKLTINAGSKLTLTPNTKIIVKSSGILKINGTQNNLCEIK